MPIQTINNGNPDGTQIGGPTDKISFYGAPPANQRSNSLQYAGAPSAFGEIVTYSVLNTAAPGNAAANTTSEVPITVTGLATTDFVLAINKNSSQAGLGICGGRISAANVLQITYCNNTASATSPASELFGVSVLRGVPYTSQTLSPVTVAASSQAEQTFTITPTSATGSAILSNGQVIGVSITSGGAGYTTPPTVVFSGGIPDSPQSVLTGAGTTFGSPLPLPYTSDAPGGSGAQGIAIINSAGAVIGVRIMNPGSGYQVAPKVTFVGGNNIVPGQMLFVNKPSLNAGVGITNCRVVDQNKIGITYTNFTTSAVAMTSEAYLILALQNIPTVSPMIRFGVCTSTPGINIPVTTITEAAYTVTGLLSTDIPISGQWKVAPCTSAGTWPIVTRVGSGAVSVGFINFGSATSTVGGLVWDLIVMRQAAQVPFSAQPIAVTYTSVGANTSAELAVTVTLPVSTLVAVNNLTPGSNWFVAPMARVSAANTLQLNVFNLSSSAQVPTAGTILLGNMAQEKQSINSGMASTPGYTAQPISYSLDCVLEGTNESAFTLLQAGIWGGGF